MIDSLSVESLFLEGPWGEAYEEDIAVASFHYARQALRCISDTDADVRRKVLADYRDDLAAMAPEAVEYVTNELAAIFWLALHDTHEAERRTHPLDETLRQLIADGLLKDEMRGAAAQWLVDAMWTGPAYARPIRSLEQQDRLGRRWPADDQCGSHPDRRRWPVDR